jgi:hypothetical protein
VKFFPGSGVIEMDDLTEIIFAWGKRGEVTAVGRKRHLADALLSERMHRLSRRWVPDPDLPVCPARSQPRAVRGVGDGGDLGVVPRLVCRPFLAGGRIPQADGVVHAADGHGFPVGG